MKLKSLNIRRWITDDSLRGTIEFENEKEHKVELRLSDEQTAKILDVCADTIVAAVTEAANIMRSSIVPPTGEVEVEE